VSRLPLLAAIVGLATLSAAAPGAASVSSEQAVAFLNQQRAANGIPGDLRNRPDWADGCAKHNVYMKANGGELTHFENSGSPYFTPEGSEAGRSSVLSAGDGYASDGRNPWEWAPIHLYAMLKPENASAGYSANAGSACMRVYGDDRPSPPEPQFFSYPGPGTEGIYPEESAEELPYVPQQLVGIPAGKLTGTNILFFSLGTQGLEAEGFSLAGPSGPVAARMVDETTNNEVGNGAWFRGGGVLVPEHPLAPYTTYSVSVTWRDQPYGDPNFEAERQIFRQDFAFTTGPSTIREPVRRPPPRHPRLRLRRLPSSSQTLRFTLTAGRMLRGRIAYVSVLRHERGCGPAFASEGSRCGWRMLGRRHVSQIRLKQAQRLQVRGPDRWQKLNFAVRTRPFRRAGTQYAAAGAAFETRR
jgi:hypothetical protein